MSTARAVWSTACSPTMPGAMLRIISCPLSCWCRARRCVLHELISNTLDFFYGEAFFDFPDSELEAHRNAVREAGLSFPVESERRILDGTWTFEDQSATYDVISAAREKIEVPSVFHTLFADRNFIISFQHDLQHFLKTKGPIALSGQLTSQGKIGR